jgi:chorismate mutase
VDRQSDEWGQYDTWGEVLSAVLERDEAARSDWERRALLQWIERRERVIREVTSAKEKDGQERIRDPQQSMQYVLHWILEVGEKVRPLEKSGREDDDSLQHAEKCWGRLKNTDGKWHVERPKWKSNDEWEALDDTGKKSLLTTFMNSEEESLRNKLISSGKENMLTGVLEEGLKWISDRENTLRRILSRQRQAQVVNARDPTQSTEATNVTNAQQSTEATNVTNAQQSTEATNGTNAQQSNESTNMTNAQQSNESTNVTNAQQSTEATNVTNAQQPTESTNVTNAQQSNESTNTTITE